MPTPVKALENMSKNLTDEERQLREQAEEGVIPDRGRESRMEEPAIMTKNPAGQALLAEGAGADGGAGDPGRPGQRRPGRVLRDDGPV